MRHSRMDVLKNKSKACAEYIQTFLVEYPHRFTTVAFRARLVSLLRIGMMIQR